MNNGKYNEAKPGVLIIDDSSSIQKYVKELLEEAGFRIFTAADGRTGLESIELCNPDIVLLDIEMPGMSGLDVLDAIGNDERLYSVLLFSHLSGSKNRIIGLEKGADDYITKPISPDELIARVKAASRTTELKKQLDSSRHTAEDALAKFRDAHDRLIEEQKITSIARLAALIAHEINNPLGFIKSNFNTIEKYSDKLLMFADHVSGISDSLSSNNELDIDTFRSFIAGAGKSTISLINNDLKPLISETSEGIDRISTILKRLLIIDRSSAGTKTEAMDVNSMIRHLHDDGKFTHNSQLTLKTSLDASPFTIDAKSDQIRIALENIVENAVDAVSGQGVITISTHMHSQQWIDIDIHDSGEGISDSILSSVFKPFFSTRKSADRIGLGLAVAELFIKAHSGQITINSKAGKGTSVIIRLPVNAVSDKHNIVSSPHPSPAGAAE